MSIELRLTRLARSEVATRGVLAVKDSKLLLATLELPWKNNAPQISCIPPGYYQITATKNRTLPNKKVLPMTFEILGVPGRSGVLIHALNYPSETRGCIGVALSFAGSPDYEQIHNSSAGMKEIEALARFHTDGFIVIEEQFL